MTALKNGQLFLVIPPVVRLVDGIYEVESDFSQNLRMYLENFTHVTFACPVFPADLDKGIILRSSPLQALRNSKKLSFIPLPYAYREDRYLRHYLATKKLLASEIAKAEYLVFSPHAPFDWSTLAARLAIKKKRKFDIESDHDHYSAQRFALSTLPFGLRRLRKDILARLFIGTVENCLSHSALALLQGKDVFNAHSKLAPNPHRVLNVQVSSDDQIAAFQLEAKLARIKANAPLLIAYAGQAIARKGPFDWLAAIHRASEAGVQINAIWFGDGPELAKMKLETEKRGIENIVSFPGTVARTELMSALRQTDIFLFCHKMAESPRCLGEALASGCALVGYGTEYPRELVAIEGGGDFVDINDWRSLAEKISCLNQDRTNLRRLVEAAASSGRLLDRDLAMQSRINLIKTYLSS